MTQLAITPNYDKKTARFRGTVAAGEHIEVRILGGGEWIQTGLRLRVCDCVRTLAEFPQRDEQGGYTVGSWQQDGYDAICELNLNTVQMQKAVRGCPAISLVFVLDNPDEDTMYFTDCHEINGWRRDAGDELPYDLDAFPGLIDSWKAQLAGLKLEATQTEYGVRLVVCDGLTPEKEVEVRHGRDGRDGMDGADGEVTAEQMKAAIAVETDRAKAAEQANATAVENEMTRAKAAEQRNATAIANEVARAQAAETANNNLIVREINRSNAADKSLAEDIAATDGIAKDAQGKANILIGNDSGKSARTIAGEEMAKLVADAPAAYDTLKEIADYIATDKEGAAAMAASIAENKSAIEKLDGAKQDKLTAGENITIEGNTISVTGGGGGGSVEVDNELSQNSPNPVKSSGIWSAIWGFLTTKYTNVVDWAKSYFLPLSGGTMTGKLTISNSGEYATTIELGSQLTPPGATYLNAYGVALQDDLYLGEEDNTAGATWFSVINTARGENSSYVTKNDIGEPRGDAPYGMVVGAQEAWTALSTKQDLLTAGTGITIEDNVISATGGGGGGGSVTVDEALSDTSTNPVQNKTVKAAVDAKADQIIFPCGVSIGSEEEKGSTEDGSQINIGKGSRAWGSNSIAIGHNAKANGPVNVAIGKDVSTNSGALARNVIIGAESRAGIWDGVAIGAGHILTEDGEIAIGAGNNMADGYEASATAKANTIRVKGGVLTVGGKEIGGGGSATVDDTLSNTSTNPIQNQWLGKRMGATSSNSVQIGYGAKAGKSSGQAVNDSGGDNGYQVAVGRGANGSGSGAAVGYDANGSTYGVAVGYNADGSSNGAAVGRIAKGSTYGVAVGYNADGSTYGIAIGANSMTNYTSYIATIGVESSNSVQYSLQTSAYNNAQQTFFAQRLIAGETPDDSYIDFYHRDRLSGEIKGRRISATNFFALLDANGATDISTSGGDYSA